MAGSLFHLVRQSQSAAFGRSQPIQGPASLSRRYRARNRSLWLTRLEILATCRRVLSSPSTEATVSVQRTTWPAGCRGTPASPGCARRPSPSPRHTSTSRPGAGRAGLYPRRALTTASSLSASRLLASGWLSATSEVPASTMARYSCWSPPRSHISTTTPVPVSADRETVRHAGNMATFTTLPRSRSGRRPWTGPWRTSAQPCGRRTARRAAGPLGCSWALGQKPPDPSGSG